MRNLPFRFAFSKSNFLFSYFPNPRKNLLLPIICFTAISLSAAPVTWDGDAADGLWSNPLNWDGNTLPGAGDNVIISNGDAVTLSGAATVQGIEIFSTSSLTLTGSGDLSLSGSSLNGLSLTNDATLTNDGTITISSSGLDGANFSGNALLTNNGTISVSNSSSDGMELGSGATLENNGTISLNNIGSDGLSSRGTINNNGSGVIDINTTGNEGIDHNSGAVLTNAGSITITGAGNEGIENDATVINSGDLTILNSNSEGFNNGFSDFFENSGTVIISGTGIEGIENDGTIDNLSGGIIDISNSTLDGIANGPGDNINNSGTILISNSSDDGVLNEGNFDNSGLLEIVNSIGIDFLNVGGNLNNTGTFMNAGDNNLAGSSLDGTIEPGSSAGTMTFAGNQTFTGTIESEINGTGLGTDYDHISVAGTGDFSGATFNVTLDPGFTPTTSDVFQLACAGNIVGTPTISLPAGNWETTITSTCISISPAAAAPTAICQNVSVDADSNCDGIANAADFDNGSSDPQGGALTFSVAPSGPFGIGTTSVVLTATNPNGDSDQCNATITVNDIDAPIVSCPNDVTIAADEGGCTATNVNIGTGTASDNCYFVNPVASSTSTSFSLGTTSVTWTATDDAGNFSNCIQDITVTDDEPPTISCPVDVTIAADEGGCTATNVNIGTGTASDNCYFVNPVASSTSTTFSLGTTSVTWTATDDASNFSNCIQDITVTDDEPPTISCPADVSVDTDPGTCEATNVALGSEIASDNCMLSSVSNDAPASFSGGTTIVTWTAIDDAENLATCTQNVTVLDTEAPSVNCPNDITIAADEGGCIATNVSIGSGTASDNCYFVNPVASSTSTSFSLGGTSITWTATDDDGNSSSCLQNITVILCAG